MPHIPDVSTLLKTRDKLKQRVQASSTQNHPDQWSSNAPNGNYEGPNGNYGSPDGGLGSQEGLKGGLESVNQLVPSSSENVLPPQYRQGNQGPYQNPNPNPGQWGAQTYLQASQYPPPQNHPGLPHAQSTPSVSTSGHNYGPGYGQPINPGTATPNLGYGYPSSGAFPQAQHIQQAMPQPPDPVYFGQGASSGYNPPPSSQSSVMSSAEPTLSGYGYPNYHSTPVQQSQAASSYHNGYPSSQSTPTPQSGAASGYYNDHPSAPGTPSQPGQSYPNSYNSSSPSGPLNRQGTVAGYPGISPPPPPEFSRTWTAPANMQGEWNDGSPTPPQHGFPQGNGPYY